MASAGHAGSAGGGSSSSRSGTAAALVAATAESARVLRAAVSELEEYGNPAREVADMDGFVTAAVTWGMRRVVHACLVDHGGGAGAAVAAVAAVAAGGRQPLHKQLCSFAEVLALPPQRLAALLGADVSSVVLAMVAARLELRDTYRVEARLKDGVVWKFLDVTAVWMRRRLVWLAREVGPWRCR